MKKLIINYCINIIEKKNKYSKEDIEKIKYGLEGIYLSFTKIFIIIILALIFGILKNVLIYLLIYNIIRMPSFGLHATKSWICLLSSIVLFIGIPYLCIYITIPLIIKIIIGIIGIIFMFKNSPADTKKRPIVNKKRRTKYKYISTIIAIVYIALAIVIKDQFICNCFLLSLIMQNFMISPTVYKIFKLPYNNYIKFLEEHPDFVQ